jgi:6-phosphogluconate dehydrogenase
MRLGMVGLGRMGANLTRRLMRHGHEVVVHDVRPEPIRALQGEGAIAAGSIDALVGELAPPRVAWVMVPAAHAVATTDALAERMQTGDVVIDGGNSYYLDDVERASRYADRGVHFVDVGTSGGVFGLERGFCLMIGGQEEVVRRLDPVFAALAPGVDAAPRTPGRTGANASTAEAGYLHCGPPGAGHFVKMVHNGIEYGIMAAYAEGLNVLSHADEGLRERADDAETAPLRDPSRYRYRFDVAEIAEVWRRGSVVSSWLLDLTAAALLEDPTLERFTGRVADSGEGRWTALAAVEEGIPIHVLSAALFDRFRSQGGGDFADRVLSAMRERFGGHAEREG